MSFPWNKFKTVMKMKMSKAQDEIEISSVSETDAYRAAVKGELDTIRDFYQKEEGSSTSIISAAGDTVLHVLAFYRQVDAVEKLLLESSLPPNALSVQNCKGNTALHEAIRSGSMDIVKAMVREDEGLVSIANKEGETPFYWAAAYGENEILRFLFQKINIHDKDKLFRRNDNSTIFHAAVTGEFYGLAQEIISSYRELALIRNDFGITAFDLIAQSPTSFKSGTMFMRRNLGACTFIPMQLLALLIYFCLPAQRKKTEAPQLENLPAGKSKTWTEEIADAKEKHRSAEQLVKELVPRSISSLKDDIKEPLLTAARYGIVEVVKIILTEFREAIEFVDNNDKNILHLSVEYRCEQVFEYLNLENFPITRMVADVDMFGNTALHLAAMMGEPPVYVQGAYQQMTWDIQWFKRVEGISLSRLRGLINYNGYTAEGLFKETHHSVLEESERWVKNTTNSHMVISTLIAAINFAAAFTVPGGVQQDLKSPYLGFPIFIKKPMFLCFLIFVSLALFFSVGSLAAAFSANLSRFNQEDYYLLLPLKFLIGFTSFYLSVICTICAYYFGFYCEAILILIPVRSAFLAIFVSLAIILVSMVYLDLVWPYICSVFSNK